MRDDLTKALKQVNESLSTNTGNNRAVALKASLQRKLGDVAGAQVTLEYVAKTDPLDFRIMNERYLIAKSLGDRQKADSLLELTGKKMRDYDENYLDVAVGYINDGLLAEAEEVLLRFPGNNPVVDYYLGYIYDRNGHSARGKQYFTAASNQQVESVFPHRLETVEVLKSAIRNNPADGKAYYYTGNILYEKQPEVAINYWEEAVSLNPELAMAYRNLGWGYYRHFHDIPEAIGAYEKALAQNPDQAIWYTELDELYELSNTSADVRLRLFDGRNDVVKQRDDAFIRQLEVLTLAGQPDKAVDYLKGVEFAYREGSSKVREIIIDAQLMLGRNFFNRQEYEKALSHFLEARIPDEEAGSARWGNRDWQVEYFIGQAYEAIGNSAEAKAAYAKSAGSQSNRISVMDYYRGMAKMKAGEDNMAKGIFEAMIAEAEKQLLAEHSLETGVIFGAREAENSRRSRYLTMKGLGNKGLGKLDLAKSDLERAVELSQSNLWARVELNDSL